MHELSLSERVRDGLRQGSFYSCAYVFLGAILLLFRGSAILNALGVSGLAYFGLFAAGGILGGVVAGALEPYTRSLLGRMVLGVLVAFPIGLLGAAAMQAPDDAPSVIWATATLWALTAGPIGGFIFWRT